MSKQIGKGTEAYACTTKGKELAAHDPRGDKIRAYSYAMGTNGGDHHEGQGPQALANTAMSDSLCICTFTSLLVLGASMDKVITDMLNPLCGWNWKTEDYWTAAKRIMTVERVFNVREGISAKDDRLPKRMYSGEAPGRSEEGRRSSPMRIRRTWRRRRTASSAGTRRVFRRRRASRPMVWSS